MAWDLDELRAGIAEDFAGFGDYFVNAEGAALQVVDPNATAPRRPVGRPPTLLTAYGQTRAITEWAAMLGCDTRVIFGRLRRGWTPERAVSTPLASAGSCIKGGHEKADRIRVGNIEKTIPEWAEVLGCHPNTIYLRLQSNWLPALAVTTPARCKPRRQGKRRVIHRTTSAQVESVRRVVARAASAQEQLAMAI